MVNSSPKGDQMSDSDAATPDLMVALLLQLHEEAKSSHSVSLQYEMVDILLRKRVTMPNHISTWIRKQGIPKIQHDSPETAVAPKEKRIIQHAIDLYEMMAQLIPFCEPDGPGVGPACRVRLLEFEHMTVSELFARTSHMRFLWRLDTSHRVTRAIDLLDAQERKLYKQARECGFNDKDKPKPTLQSLAADILFKVHGKTVFRGLPRRFVKALEGVDFPGDGNPWRPTTQSGHRRRTISMVNSFGKDRKAVGPAMCAVVAEAAAPALAALMQSAPNIAKLNEGLAAAFAVDPEILRAQAAAIFAISATTSEIMRSSAAAFGAFGRLFSVESDSEEHHDPAVIKGPWPVM